MINTTINRLDQQYLPATDRVQTSRFSGKEMKSSGTDILEISAEGRKRYSEKMSTALTKAVSRVSGEIKSQVEIAEKHYDSVRNARILMIKESFDNGSYNTDSIVETSGIADIMANAILA